MPEREDLVAHVRERRVVVIGAGAAGLAAAWECARVGLTVTVVDAADSVGGSLAPRAVDGVEVDGAHTDLRPGDTDVDDLLRVLGCADREPVTDARVAVAGRGPAPTGGLLGIPSNPWAADVRGVIGWSGTWRAYLDRVRPPMTIGREPRLGALVRRRLGERVADRLVAPIAAALWETDLDELDADAVLPGVSTALTRTGSLTGAVSQLQAEPAPPRRALRGGFGPLIAALDGQLRDLGAELILATEVTGITRAGAGWRVAGDGIEWEADAVIVATDAADARRLLLPVAAGLTEAFDRVDEVEVVTLALEDAGEDAVEVVAFPVGSSVFSVTDVTARSPRGTLPERRVVRVVLPASDRDDDALFAEAAAAAASVSGPAVPRVRGATRRRRVAAGTGRRVGDADRTAAARAALADHDGLYAVGGWLAGGDLRDEIGDAVRTAERVRHDLLWGAEPDIATL